ncbi:MAG: hypothetical protein M1814_003954 [Vezdaea aestivalis]|nr:MAG: hypothetical protein M1814_003954 [Vezdaea aestivalis]
MKIQIVVALLPCLARVALGFPATDPPPSSSIDPTGPSNITDPLPFPTADDPNELLIEDDTAVMELNSSAPILPTEEGFDKRALPTKLHWKADPNLHFRVGNSIRIHVDLTLHSSGHTRFYTRVNNRRHWGKYKYTVACSVWDREKRALVFSHHGKVCKVRSSCHIDTKDDSEFNETVKRYWEDIVRGDKIMHVQAAASWDFGSLLARLTDGASKVFEILKG